MNPVAKAALDAAQAMFTEDISDHPEVRRYLEAIAVEDEYTGWLEKTGGMAMPVDVAKRRDFVRVALAGNRYGIDWQAFADRFMLPGVVIGSARGGGKSMMQRQMLTALVESSLSRYWRRRLESNRRRANRKARRA